ncbi:NAD(P)-dependent oxidoreductase [Hydrogenimonas sp. SS33]|uniref:NAD(P)-dependent oxidoreductase n=1 Tax=Hydrogenimonas leucolamina TaxID=2954236 RepID=UPI00336BD2F1
MEIAFFETTTEDRDFFEGKLSGHSVHFFEEPIQAVLGKEAPYEAVSVFVHSKVDENVIGRLPHLRYVQTRSTGYDHIDCSALYRRGILLSNVAGYAGPAVSEFAFSLLLNATRHTHVALHRSKEGNYEYHDLLGSELFGKRIGILGLGTIGSRMAYIAKGFGMEIKAWSRSRRPVVDELGIDFYHDLDAMLPQCDVVMIALPLTPATKDLIDARRAELLDKNTIIVNVARGEIIEKSLYATLPNILCLDVTADLEATRRENVLYTPHMAYYTREALQRIRQISQENLRAFIEGRPLPNCLKISCEREYGKSS